MIPDEPIGQVMVAAKQSVGLFGGALRRILYTAQRLDTDVIRQAQCLTKQATQKVLSVKAGKEPMRYVDFGRQLQRLLRGEPLELTGIGETAEEFKALVQDPHLAAIWGSLMGYMSAERPAWQEWMLNPHELPDLLEKFEAAVICLPPNDIRVEPLLVTKCKGVTS